MKEFEILQKIAQQGINDKEYVEEHIIGFEALKKSEQKCLLQSLQQPAHLVPEELPASQVTADVALTPHATPQQLREPLKSFQQEGLSWLLQREAKAEGNGQESGAHVLRGGILADEMGMGKTLQIIALLVASPAAGATLVVVPPTCLAQWRAEIAEFVEPGTLETFEYRCNKTLPEHFNGKAVVLTTYSTLERDFRRQLDTLEEPPRKRRRGEPLQDREAGWNTRAKVCFFKNNVLLQDSNKDLDSQWKHVSRNHSVWNSIERILAVKNFHQKANVSFV